MTTYTLKRKTFAFSWFGIRNIGNAMSGTKTVVNKNILAQGNAAMKNATTDAARQQAQKTIDSATTTKALNGGGRAWEATKGVAKL